MRACSLVGGWVGRWVGGWVRKIEENEAVVTSYCELWVGGWVGGWVVYLFLYRD